MTPAQAFVGPTLTPTDLDLQADADLQREWDEVLEDAFFSDGAVEVDTFPPAQTRAAQPVYETLPELAATTDDLDDWVRPRSRWPARLFAVGAAAMVIGLAGFGFGMALEASKTDAAVALPTPAAVLAAPVDAPTELDSARDRAVEIRAPARIYPLQAEPIPAIGPTEDTPGTRTARRRTRNARRTLPARRTVPEAAPPPPSKSEAPLSVRSLKPAVSVSALPPAE